MSESPNQSRIRQHYAEQGVRLWRNNIGVLLDKRGVPVRYGLANDSAALNGTLKSGDLIGWKPRLILPDMVGDVIAEFWSIEAKPDGWTFPRPTDKERFAHAVAQRRWAEMVIAEGGVAGFMIEPTKGFEQCWP